MLEVTYNGSRGVHLYDIKNYNIPGSGNLYLGDPLKDPVSGNTALTYLNPQFSNDNNRGSNGDSYYNGVNVQVTTQRCPPQRSLVHHATTPSATRSTTSAPPSPRTPLVTSNSAIPTPSIQGWTTAAATSTSVIALVLAPIYKTPSFAGKPGILRQVLGSYQITGIYTVRSGTPFTFYDSTNNNSGYQVVRYNPISPVSQKVFKSIPANATNDAATSTLSPAPPLSRSTCPSAILR